MDRLEIERGVREVLLACANLPVDATAIEGTASLYDAGMTSHSTVRVMLGLEDRFDLEFPDEYLERSIFAQVDSIVIAIETIMGPGQES